MIKKKQKKQIFRTPLHLIVTNEMINLQWAVYSKPMGIAFGY